MYLYICAYMCVYICTYLYNYIQLTHTGAPRAQVFLHAQHLVLRSCVCV